VKKTKSHGPLLGMRLNVNEYEFRSATRVPFRFSAYVFAGAMLEIACVAPDRGRDGTTRGVGGDKSTETRS